MVESANGDSQINNGWRYRAFQRNIPLLCEEGNVAIHSQKRPFHFSVTYNRRLNRIGGQPEPFMIASTAASLVNLLRFITGVVLYVMLLWMVLTARPESNRLALLTGLLGFAWNAGAFGGYGMVNLGFTQSAPVLLAAAFSSLGFLPAVVVHSALRTAEVTRF